MRMGWRSGVAAFCAGILAASPGAALTKRTAIPPLLGKTFLEKAYRGKNLAELYSWLTSAAQKENSFAQFKKLLRERDGVGVGTKFSLKILRQEAFSNSNGMLYYAVQVNYPSLSFKKDFYALERIQVEREFGEWKLSGMPVRLIVGDMKNRCGKNEFTILFTLMEQDRAREVLAYSRNQAVSSSMAAAAELAQKKEFRRALVEYQKVLSLEGNNPEALSGAERCKEALARNENAD